MRTKVFESANISPINLLIKVFESVIRHANISRFCEFHSSTLVDTMRFATSFVQLVRFQFCSSCTVIKILLFKRTINIHLSSKDPPPSPPPPPWPTTTSASPLPRPAWPRTTAPSFSPRSPRSSPCLGRPRRHSCGSSPRTTK